ncbi:uncharacterized protein rab11fip5a isoform X4 [Stigmatopora argus]
MYDLVMKDKGGASTFSKLKERMRGKRRSIEDGAAPSPSPSPSPSSPPTPPAPPLAPTRRRLPSDGGGEEDYEDDEGGEIRRSKMRTFFLRGKLRKSSDTRSSTSLGSESSESSSRGGSLSPTAGISVVVSDLSDSPSNSSDLTADSPERTENPSPKLSPSRLDPSDETKELTAALPQQPPREPPPPPPPRGGVPAPSPTPQKTLPHSASLQNLGPRTSADPLHGTVGDGRRWSFDKAGEEESAAIAAAMEKNGPVVEAKPSLVAPPGIEPALSPLHHSNPFCPSPPGNPFSSLDPFSDWPEPFCGSFPPPLPFLSGARPPIEELFPEAARRTPEEISDAAGEKTRLGEKSSNPFAPGKEPGEEWDASFEEFASRRLQEPKDQTSGVRRRDGSGDEASDSPSLKSFSFSSLDPIPEDDGPEYHGDIFGTSAESFPDPEWQQVDRAVNVAPAYPESVASSGIGTSVEDDFLSSRSSYSASGKFSTCSPDKTEPRGSSPGLETSMETAASLKSFSSTDEFSTEDQQSEDTEWWDSDGSQVFTPPPTSSTGLETIEPDLQQESKFFQCSDAENQGGRPGESGPQESLGVRTSSPSTEPSSGVQDHRWESLADPDQSGDPSHMETGVSSTDPQGSPWFHPVPENVTDTNEMGLPARDDRSSQGLPEPDLFPEPFEGSQLTVLNHAVEAPPSQLPGKTPNTASFRENVDGTLPFNQNQDQISRTLETLASENPDIFGETGTILRLVNPEHPVTDPNNHTDGSDALNPGFTSSEVLPVTSPDRYEESFRCDQKNLPPELPKISQSTRDFLQSLDSKLQYHQNSHEKIHLEDSSFGGELGHYLEPASTFAIPQGSPDDPKPLVWSSLGTADPWHGAHPTDFDPNPVGLDQFSTLDQVLAKRPPPRLPETSQGASGLEGTSPDYFGESNSQVSTLPVNWTCLGELVDPLNGVGAPAIPEGSSRDVKAPDWSSLLTEDVSDLRLTDDESSEVLSDSDPNPVGRQDFAAFDPYAVTTRASGAVQNLDGLSQECWGASQSQVSTLPANWTLRGDASHPVSFPAFDSPFSQDLKPPDWLSPANEDFSDLRESALTAWDHGSPEVLPDSHPNPAADDPKDEFARRLPPRLPKIFQRTMSVPVGLQAAFLPAEDSALGPNFNGSRVRHHSKLQRTQSASTLTSDLDKSLLPSFWKESWAFPASSSRSASPSLSTASAPPLSRRGSCFPSPLSTGSAFSIPSGAPAPNLQEVGRRHDIQQELSPHPVRPLSSLDKIKSSFHSCKSVHSGEKILTEGAGSYYHLSHSELVGLVVRREAELERQKSQFERQRALLAKREVELRRLKPQVRDLEDYIDTLLVRIMEQKPTLLQEVTRKCPKVSKNQQSNSIRRPIKRERHPSPLPTSNGLDVSYRQRQ